VKVVKHLRIHGRVQGVGYRYSLAEAATLHGVTGWVRNRRDGTVEAVIAGDEAAVESIIAWARRGPDGAAVIDVKFADAEGSFSGFETRATA
jgi:acylphosphatase